MDEEKILRKGFDSPGSDGFCRELSEHHQNSINLVLKEICSI
jgi:hypothetical protein